MVVYVYENCSLFSWKLVKGLASKPEKKKTHSSPFGEGYILWKAAAATTDLWLGSSRAPLRLAPCKLETVGSRGQKLKFSLD